MDSYLSNIDTYMQQQQQQEQLLKRQREQQQQQQQLLLQQQQQNTLAHLTSQPMNDNIWLSNIPGGSLPQTPEMYSNPTLYMSNPTSSPSYNTTPLFNHQQLPNYPLQPPNMLPPYELQQPIRQRKKPGRKPNPASPALRKAQNRAAQRAFRERKERHLKDLETTIRNLRDQRNNVTRELNTVKSHLESYKAESWYLKGVVLTLQFVCMHHNINIPTHSPYLSEEALVKMARTAPHAIEAYVNSYTRNNSDLNRTYQFVQKATEEDTATHSPSPEYHGDDEEDEEHYHYNQQGTEGEEEHSSLSPPPLLAEPPSSVKNEEEHAPVISSSMDAIQQIRLKLGLLSHHQQHANQLEDDDHLKPTILQLATPHDPRIDLVPTPHMRDRMIIFRDQMDYDRCFTMLLNEAVYHGGDPTKSESWELPADFFSEFWYLTIDYDIKKTNKWRRIKGLSDVEAGPQLQQQQQQSRQLFNDDEVLDQIVKDMPSLQPVTRDNRPSSKYFYNMLMREPPESRPRLQSPTLENIIDLMKSL